VKQKTTKKEYSIEAFYYFDRKNNKTKYSIECAIIYILFYHKNI